jgi:hypothetical protein
LTDEAGSSSFAGSDYERACALPNCYAGILPVGTGQGYVLSDCPNPTAWWPERPVGVGCLVRWNSAESDTEVIRHLRHMPDRMPIVERHELVIGSGPLLVFDSAYHGDDVTTFLQGQDCLVIEVPAGVYVVSISIYQPDEQTSLTIHDFVMARRSSGEECTP